MPRRYLLPFTGNASKYASPLFFRILLATGSFVITRSIAFGVHPFAIYTKIGFAVIRILPLFVFPAEIIYGTITFASTKQDFISYGFAGTFDSIRFPTMTEINLIL